MTLNWEELVVDSADCKALGQWWANALGWSIIYESDDELEIQHADGAKPTILFLNNPDTKTVKNRLHLDFVPDDQAAEVERLVGLGATRKDIGQRDVSWVVMSDPEGNEFCVLSARNDGE